MIERSEMLPVNRFQVVIGNHILGFSKASNLEDSMEYDSYVEGGLNDAPWIWMKPSQQMHTLTLEKGAQIRPLFGEKLTLLPGTEIEGGILLMVNDLSNQMARVFSCQQAVVVKWEISPLDALSGDMLIEKVEIAHSGLKEVR